jgi:hypothetical protein
MQMTAEFNELAQWPLAVWQQPQKAMEEDQEPTGVFLLENRDTGLYKLKLSHAFVPKSL